MTEKVANMKLHEKIRQLREQNHLSQEQMAEKLNMSKAGYSKIERGETHSNFNKLEQILAIFDMSLIDFVMFGEDKNISINNSENHSNSYFSLILSDKNAEFEQEKLNLMLAQKDEVIANKNELITQLKQENEVLKEMIALLKAK